MADVGAGTGYISRRIAKLVGPQGIVYAVDVQPEMVKMLGDLARRDKLAQIRPILGAIDDVKLPPASVDLAHDGRRLSRARGSVRGAHQHRARAQAGRPASSSSSTARKTQTCRSKRCTKMSVAQVQREASALPLVLERVAEPLPWQHIIVFRKRSSALRVRAVYSSQLAGFLASAASWTSRASSPSSPTPPNTTPRARRAALAQAPFARRQGHRLDRRLGHPATAMRPTAAASRC